MRLIDANKLFQETEGNMHNNPHKDPIHAAMHKHEHRHFLCEIDKQPEIDPVHAAGAVYFKECKYHDDEVYPDSEWELHDYQECWCNWWDSVMPINGFCSEGRKDDNT